MKNIVVVGSSNTDMVTVSEKLPARGETIIGKKFFINPGGKGANQAVAAQRLGAQVFFIARVGNDLFGGQALETYQKEGINTQYILTDEEAGSGVALINVDGQGENTIVVAPGANARLSKEDLERAQAAFAQADIVITQLETPLETVMYLTQVIKKLGKKLILNPAPARPLPDDLLNGLYMITPNEPEVEQLTGIKTDTDESLQKAAALLRAKGVEVVVITLGERGAYLHSDAVSCIIPAPSVHAVDTTAAGDTFNGALAVAIAEGGSLTDAVHFANQCAAIAVTREGAQSSVPYRNELSISISLKL